MDNAFYIADAISLLKTMISIPSISKEEEQVADLIQRTMESYGLTTYRLGNNLWTISTDFDENKPTVLLNSHMDTVKPVSGWNKQPYTAHLQDGRIYGLGSNDAGASLVSLLATFLHLTRKQQTYNLIFLASCEEEISGHNGIEAVLPKLPALTFALVGEPTQMHPAIAEKGLMVVDAEATGISGHAAREEGINAIYNAIRDITWIQNHTLNKQSDLIGPVRMSVTQIEAGSQHNVIPDTCKYVIDVRSNEFYSNQEIFNILEENLQSKLQARSFRLNSSKMSPTHPFVQKCLAIGRKPFGSPTLSDQALIQCPSLKMGPGDSARSHTADEYICIQEIEEAIPMYCELLDGLEIE
ncbi:MAG TPA: M20 family metallo-hydrolase [Bacteroidaceae bacterium]|nr:M20 family metallo-hydrolase [Bacteroidaceae bacterium]